MMPVVRISEETWGRLKQWAEPLEDSPDDVVKRILDMADAHKVCQIQEVPSKSKPIKETSTVGRRISRGKKVPDTDYFPVILEAIYDLGGSGKMEDVLRLVESKMQRLFSDVDYQTLNSGSDVRWRNTAQWARFKLVERGLLRNDSPRGIWELTNQGTREVER